MSSRVESCGRTNVLATAWNQQGEKSGNWKKTAHDRNHYVCVIYMYLAELREAAWFAIVTISGAQAQALGLCGP
jgi:hypothetical protein